MTKNNVTNVITNNAICLTINNMDIDMTYDMASDVDMAADVAYAVAADVDWWHDS